MKVEALDTTGIDGLGVRTRVRLVHREELTPRVAILDFAAADATPLRPGSAGAHITLHLPSGLARQYSLCGETPGRYRIAVQREDEGRGGSREAHGLVIGDELDITGPRNSFPLSEAPQHLLIAGGIGITPIAAMAHELARRGTPFRVVLALRGVEDAPLARLLPIGCDVEVRLSAEGDRLDLAALLGSVAPNTAVYVCGPARMLTEASTWSFAVQRTGSALHLEHFEASAETVAGIHADVLAGKPFNPTSQPILRFTGNVADLALGDDGDPELRLQRAAASSVLVE